MNSWTTCKYTPEYLLFRYSLHRHQFILLAQNTYLRTYSRKEYQLSQPISHSLDVILKDYSSKKKTTPEAYLHLFFTLLVEVVHFLSTVPMSLAKQLIYRTDLDYNT